VPIYEYVCGSCRHRFEVKQSMSDPPVTSCTQCGQTVTKVISAPAIMFKGTGWYVTDYSDKLKPDTESKADEAGVSAQKKDDASTSGEKATTGAATPATSDSSGGTGTPPAAAGSNTPPAAPATPSTSSSK